MLGGAGKKKSEGSFRKSRSSRISSLRRSRETMLRGEPGTMASAKELVRYLKGRYFRKIGVR